MNDVRFINVCKFDIQKNSMQLMHEYGLTSGGLLEKKKKKNKSKRENNNWHILSSHILNEPLRQCNMYSNCTHTVCVKTDFKMYLSRRKPSHLTKLAVMLLTELY